MVRSPQDLYPIRTQPQDTLDPFQRFGASLAYWRRDVLTTPLLSSTLHSLVGSRVDSPPNYSTQDILTSLLV